MKQGEDNAWGTPSDEQQQILAMTVEMKALKQGSNKGSNPNRKGRNKFNNIKYNEESGDITTKAPKRRIRTTTSGHGRT